MAINNTVPLGQAGTGAAFRLGENRALPLYQQEVALQQQKRDQEAQALAKSYKDNMLAASGGQLFANELGQLEQKHLQKGYEYRAKGIDVYNPNPNDPNQLKAAQDYMTERREIENLRAYRKGIEDDFKRGITDLAKATEGEYDSGIINERNKIVSEGSLQDLYKRGASLPQLQKRFNLASDLKGLKAPTVLEKNNVNGMVEEKSYVDEKGAEDLVLSTLNSSGRGQAAILKATGGIPPSELQAFPDSLSGIEATLKENYYGDPVLAEQLAANQIKVGSPKFEELVKKEATAIAQAKKGYKNLINDGVNIISQGTKRIDKSTPEITAYQRLQLQNKEEDQALARQRLQLAKSREQGTSTGVGDALPITIPFGKEKKDRVEIQEYVPISVPKKNFAGSEYIDLKTGKVGGKLASSSDYEIVGVGNMPIINTGPVKGAISQPNFAKEQPQKITPTAMIHVQQPASASNPVAKDYFIPYDRLPENVKNSKSIREALSKFKPATTNTPSSTKKSDPLGLF